MRYLQKSFSLPAGPTKISQEDWDRAVGKMPRKKKGKQLGWKSDPKSASNS